MDYCFIQNNNVFWFVGFLMKWYVIYWICTKWLYKYRWGVMLLFGILLCILKENHIYVLCFPLGVWLSEHKEKLPELSCKKRFLIAVGLFVLGTMALGLKQMSFVRENQNLADLATCVTIMAYGVSVMLLFFETRLARYSRLLFFMAPFTYELYLVHMKMIPLVEYGSAWTSASTTVLFFAVSFAGAWVFHWVNVKIFKGLKL